ncbi:TonB-dependent receptor [Cellvibrio mixtus]|uniref:TonB-dependent receptor n=1 Tax=Cellvibrio mixtus TaxID=39650 RepID=UPI00058704BE|nr:TonB-dependent receptor [Cellvibrio mixtus]
MSKTLTNKQSTSFRRKLIATAVTSAMLGASSFALAQDDVEEVVITGIKASLARAMDIKRDAKGVVDAISAEDIGKFPDTNLAESLQRISGVSIDRSNNEGSKITVRGFGPEFNLVTLNGRQMPTNGSSRSFEFSDLAAESVSGVDVYKTFSADKVTGGIGSLVNINTARPLDKPGINGSIGVKGMMDTTNEIGDDVTPEVSGIFSGTFFDNTFGVAISGSYQERDSRSVNADIANWRNNLNYNPNANVVDNRTDKSGPTFYPRNFGYGIDDISRERTNGQVVLQYAPTDTIKATLDYTYSKVDYRALNTGVGIWYSDTGATLTEGIIDENGTFVRVTESGEDYASNIRLNTSQTENKSLGFNLEWQATDSLKVNFDVHDSEGENGGVGRGNDVFLILGAKQIDKKTYDATSGKDIPDMIIDFLDNGVGIVNGQPTGASYDSLFAQAGKNINKSDVTQVQIDAVWETGDEAGITSIDFGVANTKITNRWRAFNTGQLPLGWYSGNNALWATTVDFEEKQLTGLMPSFSGGASSIPIYHTWDLEKGIAIAEAQWANHAASPLPSWGTAPEGSVMSPNMAGAPNSDHTVTEETAAAYVQFNMQGELADMPLDVSTGVRYESTDIESNSYQQDPTTIIWQNPTEWGITRAANSRYTAEFGDYDTWLPSLDAALNITDDVVGRFSYSRSLTRPRLGALIGNTSITDRPKPGERNGSKGVPDLLPYTADNLDISAEWYYAEASYVSVGLFHKQVVNFIVDESVPEQVFGLRDPLQGPRAQAARAELEAEGLPLTDTNVFNRINEMAGTSGPIAQSSADPLATFQISTPKNIEDAKLQGAEFAVQHTFGESGFGVVANATLVSGDLEVDNSATDFQFALPGMSDSANLIGFYDKNGLQARIAYNWRDTFLNGIGENNTPLYTEEYGQIDISVSYDLPFVEGMTVFVEGINVTDESQRVYARYKNQFKSAYQYGARYNLGVRYSF